MADWWDKSEDATVLPQSSGNWWDKSADSNLDQSLEEIYTKQARQEIPKSSFPNLYPAMVSGGARMMAPFERLASDYEATRSQAIGRAYEKVAEEEAQKRTKYPIIPRAARGVVSTLPSMVVAGELAGPYGAIAAAGLQERDSSLSEARKQGMSEGEAAKYANVQGVVEAVPEAIAQSLGLGGLEKMFGKQASAAVQRGFLSTIKSLGFRTLEEVPSELITEIGHKIYDKVSGFDPQATSPESLWQTGADTTAQTLMTMGAAEMPNIARSLSASDNFTKPETVKAVIDQYGQEGKIADLEALAAKDKPSRSDWLKAGMPAEFTSKRAEFVAGLREALAKTPEAAPVVNEAGHRMVSPGIFETDSEDNVPDGAQVQGVTSMEVNGKRQRKVQYRFPVSQEGQQQPSTPETGPEVRGVEGTSDRRSDQPVAGGPEGPVPGVQAEAPVRVTRASVARAIPGAPIKETPHGFQVEVGQSYLDLVHTPSKTIDPENDQRAYDAYFISRGKPVPQGTDRKPMKSMGYYSTLMPDGSKHGGLGVIYLSEGEFDETTLPHELWHLAYRGGFFSSPEGKKLMDKIAPGITDPIAREEAVAKYFETLKPTDSLWAKIKAWIKGMIASMTRGRYDPRTAEEVAQQVYDPSFWQRKAARPDTAEAAQLRERDAYQMKWYLKSQQVIEEKMGGKAMPGAVLKMLENAGVKADELEWTGLAEMLGGKNAPKMVTKEQVLEALNGGVKVEEVVHGDKETLTADEDSEFRKLVDLVDGGSYNELSQEEQQRYQELNQKRKGDSSSTKFSGYQLAGKKKDYRELALTLPGKTGEKYRVPGGHQFGDTAADENRLAHVRFNSRTDSEGKKTLFIEEIQSDWSQQGREKGFGKSPALVEVQKNRDELHKKILENAMAAGMDRHDARLGASIVASSIAPDAYATKMGSSAETLQAYRDAVRKAETILRSGKTGVPDMPYKKTGQWTALALKRMVSWAAEHGFDSVSWTTGEMQNDRYSLHHHVNQIRWSEDTHGPDAEIYKHVAIQLKNNSFVDLHVAEDGKVFGSDETSDQDLIGKGLDEIIGKEAAERIMASKEGDLSSDGLKIGGEGMKGFYDQILPAEANKLIKKYGAKVGNVTIGSEPDARKNDTGIAARQLNPPLEWEEHDGKWGADGPGQYGTRYTIEPIPTGGFRLYVNGTGVAESQSVLNLKGEAANDAEAEEPEGYDPPEGWGSIGEAENHLPPTQVHGFPITESMKAAASMGQPMYQLKEHGNLANPADKQASRNFVQDERATEYEDRNWSEVRKGIQGRLTDDNYEAEKAKLMAADKANQPLSDAETFVAKWVVGRASLAAAVAQTNSEYVEAMDVIDAYTRLGTEQARGLAARRDLYANPEERMRAEVAEFLLSPPVWVQDKIAAYRKAGDKAGVETMKKWWASRIPHAKEMLTALGVDIDNLKNWRYDPVKLATATRLLSPFKSTYFDVYQEWFRGMTLSGPRTNIVNAVGTPLNAASRYTAEWLAEAALNQSPRLLGGKQIDPTGAQFEECKHFLEGALPGLNAAMRHFAISFDTEMATFDATMVDQPGEVASMDYPRVAIPGTAQEVIARWSPKLATTKLGKAAAWLPVGRAIRIPQRSMLAADQAGRAMIAYAEASGQAYRMAKAEGLSGQQMAERIKELTGDTTSAAWRKGYQEALILSGQQEGTEVAKFVKRTAYASRKLTGWKWLSFTFAPFVTYPTNILETAVHKSPLGFFHTLSKMNDNISNGRPAMKGLTKAAATQILSTAIMAMLWGNDPDDEKATLRITGSSPSWDENSRHQAQETGRHAKSIYLFGKWHSYRSVEPFATLLSSAVDLMQGIKSGAKSKEPGAWAVDPAWKAYQTAVGNIHEQPMLQGLSDIMKLIEATTRSREQGQEAASRLSANVALSVTVPNLLRSVGRALDDTKQQRGIWGHGKEPTASIGHRIAQRSEVFNVRSFPEYDDFGRELPNSVSFVPQTDFLYRFLVPAESIPEHVHPAYKMLIHWNGNNPDKQVHIGDPSKDYIQDGVRKYFTDKQYADVTLTAGKILGKMYDSGTWSVSKPSEDDMKRLEGLVVESRSIAKEVVLRGRVPSSDKEIAVLAGRSLLKDIVADRPASLTKEWKDKGYTTFASVARELNAGYDEARQYMAENGISVGELLSELDRMNAHLTSATKAARKKRLLERIKPTYGRRLSAGGE